MQFGKTARGTCRDISLRAVVPTILLLVASSFVALSIPGHQNLLSHAASVNRQDHLKAVRLVDSVQRRSNTAFLSPLETRKLGNPKVPTDFSPLHANDLAVKYDRGQALRWIPRTAAEGYPPAQRDRHYLLITASGAKQDRPQAVRYFGPAAGQGLPPAEVNFHPIAYSCGRGVARDQSTALYCARRAAKQRYPPGQFLLGTMHESGRRVQQDLSDAARWCGKTAEQEYTPGQNNHYEDGRGVRPHAIKGYQRTAEQDEETSYTNLARLYTANCVSEPHYDRTYLWTPYRWCRTHAVREDGRSHRSSFEYEHQPYFCPSADRRR